DRGVRYELRIVWTTAKAHAIKTINQVADVLKFDRQEIGGGYVDSPAFSAGRIRTAGKYLVSPEIKTALVRLAIQEVQVVLADKIVSGVNHVATRNMVRGEACVSLISNQREGTLRRTKLIVQARWRHGVELVNLDVVEPVKATGIADCLARCAAA